MNSDLEKAITRVYQKVGRNVVFFNKLENMFKHLTALNQISGYVSELQQKKQKQIASISKQTLGQVAGLFIENNASGDEIDLGPDDPEDIWINIGYTIKSERQEERNKEIVDLVEERNKLIHQFAQVCDLTSLESCATAEIYLENQYVRVQREINQLEIYMRVAQCAYDLMSRLLDSDLLNRLKLISDLQKRPSIMRLAKMPTELARTDGWTVLCKALAQLHQDLSVEIKVLKKEFQCKTLKDLMLKADIFEFFEENTKKNGVRLLYRVRPEYTAQVIEEKRSMKNTKK